VLIRCEKCSTVYELEDRLIPPGGAPVQCSRCDHVFRAMPGGPHVVAHPDPEPEPSPAPEQVPDEPAGEAGPPDEARAEPVVVAEIEQAFSDPPPTPPRVVPGPATPPPTRTPPPATPPRPVRAVQPPPRPAPFGTSNGVTPDGRPIRKVPNPDLEGGDVPIAPMSRKAISFEVGPKKRQTGRWLIAGAVALVLAFGILGAVLAWKDRAAEKKASQPPPRATAVDPAAARARQDALALLARDDAASLERAATLLDQAIRKENTPAAHADRALSLALLSQEALAEAERLEGRGRAADELRIEAAATGDVARAAALGRDAEALKAGVVPARERAARLAAEARLELDGIASERQRDPIVLRARAMTLLSAGQRGEAARIARDARDAAVRDAWLTLAGILADLPENGGAQEHALALERLDKLAAAHPELVRARFLAARIRAGMGELDRALTGLDGVLQVNPDHREAKRLRAEVAAQAAPPPAPAGLPAAGEAEAPSTIGDRVPGSAQPTGAPPAEKGAAQPRNGATQGTAR
jgi:predicted Zn finger-like uncharacterized protein